MAKEEVKLFGTWISPFVARVKWAIAMKGVDYEYIEEDLSNKCELLLKYNPMHKKVPVLVHNGKPICESSVILEYIDEIWKENPILSEDPHERAMARFWSKFGDEKVSQTLISSYFLDTGLRITRIGDSTKFIVLILNVDL